MRKIAVMIGSDSDLKQCKDGLNYLLEKEEVGEVEVVGVVTNSIHRNTEKVLENLVLFEHHGIDCFIAGAGMANHLSGTCDAYLRNAMKNYKIVVIAVAFESEKDPGAFAAKLSIEMVPGHQMVFNNFIGAKGFLSACEFAVEGKLPEIHPVKSKAFVFRNLFEAFKQAARLTQ